MALEEHDTAPTGPSPSAEKVVDNANAGCVGPTSASAGKASACSGCPNQGACSSGALASPEAIAQAQAETQALQSSLSSIQHVILVLSGKGGVGKSTLAAQISHTLAAQGYAVGLLDVDLCGPSAPRMILGDAYASHTITQNSSTGLWTPVYSTATTHPVAVMSISFMLADRNQAVVWRGPRKNALIQQFLTQVDWSGDTEGLDYLIVDTPPGTSDEHISTVQYLQKAGSIAGAVVVTTPEEVSLADVRKELHFCQKTGVKVLGIVENMSSYQTTLDRMRFVRQGADCTDSILATLREKCPEVLECVVSSPLFATHTTSTHQQSTSNGVSANEESNGNHHTTPLSGAEQMAVDYQVPYWGRVPLDTDLLQACEHGQAFVQPGSMSEAALALRSICQKIEQQLPVDMA
jgi:Mrp family chromosome partitioning ATPase